MEQITTDERRRFRYGSRVYRVLREDSCDVVCEEVGRGGEYRFDRRFAASLPTCDLAAAAAAVPAMPDYSTGWCW